MGSLNKIAMEFPDVFWHDVEWFGVALERQESSRGRCFMFWNMHRLCGRPILIGLFGGKAASDVEALPAEEACAIAMQNLRRLVFRGREAEMPRPLSYRVTGWSGDPFARGSYSYVAVGSSQKDYDDLGHPVSFGGGAAGPGRGEQPYRLFFAGEHTCKEHPDTVGGAMLSGRREATRIALALRGLDPNAEMDELIVVDDATRLEMAKDVERARRRAIDGAGDDGALLLIMGGAESNARRRAFLVEVLQLSAQTIKQMFGRACLARLAEWIREYSARSSFDVLGLLLKLAARIPFGSKEELKATALPRAILEVIKRSRQGRIGAGKDGGNACAAANRVMRRWQTLRAAAAAGEAGAAPPADEEEHHISEMSRIREEKRAAAERARAAMQAAKEAQERAERKRVELADGPAGAPETVDFEKFHRQMKRKKREERMQKKREEEAARAEEGAAAGASGAGGGGGEQGQQQQQHKRQRPEDPGTGGDAAGGIDGVRAAVSRFATVDVLQPILEMGSITAEARDSVAAAAVDKVIGGSTSLKSDSNISVSEFMSESRKRKVEDLVYAILKKQFGVKIKRAR